MTAWTCLHCPETGATDRGAEKHTKLTTHATVTHARAVGK